MDIQCFIIVESPVTNRIISRLAIDVLCPTTGKSHYAEKQLPNGLVTDKESSYHCFSEPYKYEVSEYPAKCDSCDYAFKPKDSYSFNVIKTWLRADNGLFACNQVHKAPVGAMWDATWNHDVKDWCGQDGLSICVMTPGGEWNIDSRASNCGSVCKKCHKPYREHANSTICTESIYEDSNPIHKCWIRKGSMPHIDVSKNGNTCDAGAGSIQIGSYHGFLKNGKLTNC